MARDRFSALLRRTYLAFACAPLLLALAGCPGDDATATAAPSRTSANATAPTIRASAGQQSSQPATPQASQQQNAALNAEHLRQQKTQGIIDSAEASYRSGVNNYNANRLDAARMDFDFAVDTMLSSGLDLKSEGDAADEFARLLDAINSLEMAALKQGNGFSPRLEEAPLENANDVTFPANPELVAKLKEELNTTSDLPLVINDQVAGYIGVFSQSENFRKHMAASLQRVGKYRGLIQRVLKEEGVPQDLIYLAVAESGFQPQAVNTRSGAGGMWQFMTFTGVEYGLTRNGYFDYRFDPEKSSRAYARYIKKLHDLFGDWYLAMAAYDWGPGAVQRAIQRTGYADFWELYRRNAMPGETRAYVPQILAAVLMAKNPERYGLDKLVPSPPVIYDTVSTTYAIDIRLVADLTGATVPEIVELNPALLRLSTPRDIAYDLHLPPGTRDVFLDRLKDIPEENRASWRFHIVKDGESLDQIASSLHARATEIAQFNEVTPAQPIETGDELIVPVEGVRSAGQQRYTFGRKDTLVTVADRFGVTVEQLRAWNHLSSGRVRPGHSLYVAEPVRLPRGSRSSRGRRGSRGSRGRSGGGHSSRSSGRGGHASHASAGHAHSSAHVAKKHRR